MSQNLLIVDDSATIRSMMKRTIQMIGLDVGEIYEAGNGIEALARLGEHEVAVVLIDINMPTMNGLQLIKRMKQNDRLKSIPVVIASTEGSTQRIEEMTALGIDGYVRKPFQPEQLRNVLTPLVGASENATATTGNTEDDLF